MDEMKRFERHCEDGERGERRWEDLLGSAVGSDIAKIRSV